jgi:L-alanine-DL-glutamate epimerase-like enolase superfamily enzyme
VKGSEVIRVDVFGYGLTYAHGQYVMSSGRVVEALPSPVVRIETRDGPTGYGESCPLGATYLPALGGARAAVAELAPALFGVEATNLAEVPARMDAILRGHVYAKSASDIALWDILGKSTGRLGRGTAGRASADPTPSLCGRSDGRSRRDGDFRLSRA